MSPLPGGPTAIFSVTGRSRIKVTPTAAANSIRPPAIRRSGAPLVLRIRGNASFAAVKPSGLDMSLPSKRHVRRNRAALRHMIARPCSNFPIERSKFRRRLTALLIPLVVGLGGASGVVLVGVSVMGQVYPPANKAIHPSRLEGRLGDDDGFDTDIDADVIRLLQENARLRALVTQ